MAAEVCGGHTSRKRAFFSTIARRPVHHYETHLLVVEHPAHNKLVAGDEVGLSRND